MLRIVGIGGGTGLPVLLRGLAGQTGVSVSAIVTVADNGGSSGRLRYDFGMPAVGDLRNCLAALSEQGSALAELFQYRFAAAGCLDGHALGNLVVAALYQKTGSLFRAIEIAEQIMPVRGHVIAVTEAEATLCAAFRDGAVVRGESQIGTAGGDIERVWLEPESPSPSKGVLEAIRAADAVVLAPGSLFTSLVPNLLVDGVAAAIRKSRAVKIYVCNLMTQPGETQGFSACDHLTAVESYLGTGAIRFCVVDSTAQRLFYGRQPNRGGFVECDCDRIRARGVTPVLARLLVRHGDHFRHDADRLGHVIASLARARAIRPSIAEECADREAEAFVCQVYQACG